MLSVVLGCGDGTGPATVASVEVTPTSAALVSKGESVQFTANAKSANGDRIPGKFIEWVSSDPAVATIDATGLATAVSNGSTLITAASDGIEGSASVGVDQAVSSVEVTPATGTLVSLGETVQLSAVAMDANGNLILDKTAVWSSSNSAIATVGPASGLVTAVANGAATITATMDDVDDTADLTVGQVPIVEVTPANARLTAPKEAIQFSATAHDANGNPVPNLFFTWESSDAKVVSMSATGLATTGAFDGTATITATTTGGQASTTVTVSVRAWKFSPSGGESPAIGTDGTVYIGRYGSLRNAEQDPHPASVGPSAMPA